MEEEAVTTASDTEVGTTTFANMVGVTMASIVGKLGDEQMEFVAVDGRRFVFWYEEDCCGSCSVEDACGDLANLVGSPIVTAEEVCNYAPWSPPWEVDKDLWTPESFTWTFYRFATAKGTMTVRWLGESNGYYSESVSYREEPAS
jgi:hypothetical protein